MVARVRLGGSRASGARAGDVIREIAGAPVRDMADVERLLTKRAAATPLVLVQRGPVPLYVTLGPSPPKPSTMREAWP